MSRTPTDPRHPIPGRSVMSGGMSVADVLSRAADLLEPEGAWMQGDFCNGLTAEDSTCFCIEGAIAKVRGNFGYGGNKMTARAVDWYEQRSQLRSDMVFIDYQGSTVKLDRRVPGDGTKWYVADWWGGSWAYMDSTAEPGDLVEWIAENGHDHHCLHCGRDNRGHEASSCSDNCPILVGDAK